MGPVTEIIHRIASFRQESRVLPCAKVRFNMLEEDAARILGARLSTEVAGSSESRHLCLYELQ